MSKIVMSEEHRAMILGLNMAELCGISVDQRLREEQAKVYGSQISNEEAPIDLSWESRLQRPRARVVWYTIDVLAMLESVVGTEKG
jgi:hypothetical protein